MVTSVLDDKVLAVIIPLSIQKSSKTFRGCMGSGMIVIIFIADDIVYALSVAH